MEVADQWRRQWAGTAEYGKVTEGGVTRRVARAMEVLHASGPGSRVRVMRAAYHSSAGPGAPAESFMLHSSRRVISSGFNFLEPPSLPIKPLEISSTPLELLNDSNGEIENYKVTEPDDLEISEPSKWRVSRRGSSIRMPSEESSSTDNASIIDLDSKSSKNLHRKHSYDSENSDIQFRSRSSSRTSQLLDAPTALSTLKYKSLLNSSNEWNTRRKSYSFEDTSPLNETILHGNDTLAMESSTDSGICKSTEIMNDHVDDNSHISYSGKPNENVYNKEESFKEWLSKNRQNSQHRGTKFKTYREHEIVKEDPKENNIALKSPGKVSITLPVTIESDNDAERRVKKVEFCKTEVHFAAESGKVNIIATDEKPPPSNDFRKRRSAFVPMQEMTDRPITLFGEKPDFTLSNGIVPPLTVSNGEFCESDENTAATKGILKNKIPKPKPYLLGENMDFGIPGDVANKAANDSVPTAISLVNQQLGSEKRYKGQNESTFSRDTERNVINNHVFRAINAGPPKNDNMKNENHAVSNINITRTKEITVVQNKLNPLQASPVLEKPKTRRLRESDLTYFGIDDRKANQKDQIKQTENKFNPNSIVNDIFHSVKLIQQVSNSVSNSACNSDPESEDAPEYQNIPLNINYAPVPTPRLRSKYDGKSNEIQQVRAALKPIVERKETEDKNESLKFSSRRSKVRRHEEVKASRSLSEPPKNFKQSSSHKYQSAKENLKGPFSSEIKSLKDDIPIYVNLNLNSEKPVLNIEKPNKILSRLHHNKTHQVNSATRSNRDKLAERITHYEHNQGEGRSNSGTDNSKQKEHSINRDTLSSSLKREVTRAENSNKSHHNKDARRKTTEESKHVLKAQESNYKNNSTLEKREHNSRSLQKSVPKSTSEESEEAIRNHSLKKRESSSHRKRNESKDKTHSLRENMKPQKLDMNNTPQKTMQIKTHERKKEIESRPSNKHREYVINYDDKNGTVSSICKIKPAVASPRRKKTSKEILKEYNKDNAQKSKSVDKMALLQLEDHQGNPNGLKYADRKWKTKVHVQRSCQVL